MRKVLKALTLTIGTIALCGSLAGCEADKAMGTDEYPARTVYVYSPDGTLLVEAAREMDGLHRELNAMWMGVYSNDPQISTKGVYDRAVALAVEAIQVAAMARKFERSQRRNWPGAKEPHYDEEEKQ